VVEVLSDSTRTYDTTDKLEMYRRIPTVTEVLLAPAPSEVRAQYQRAKRPSSTASTSDGLDPRPR
jgi:Uma2 family endonuclease